MPREWCLVFPVVDVLLQHCIVEVRPLLLDLGRGPVLGRLLHLEGVVVVVVIARQVVVAPLRLLQGISGQTLEHGVPGEPALGVILPGGLHSFELLVLAVEHLPLHQRVPADKLGLVFESGANFVDLDQ